MSGKMYECKTCKHEIARNAKVCPNCGAKVKKSNPILIGIVCIIALIAIFGSTNSNEPTKVGDNNAEASTTAASQVQKNIFTVGEIVELKDVQVSLVNVTKSSGSDYNKPTEGNIFILCEFEIVNNSDKEITVSSMMSFEAYCDDYACTQSIAALMEKGTKNQLDGTVAPGKKMNGVIGYEIPADWSEFEIQFTPDFWSGKDIVFVATNN